MIMRFSLFKKIFISLAVFALCFSLMIPAFAVSSSDITQTGNVLGSGVGLPAGHSRNIAFPYFAASPSVKFLMRVSSGVCYFTFNNANYQLDLETANDGNFVVPFLVYSQGETIVFYCRNSSSIPYFSIAGDRVTVKCFSFYRFNLIDGNIDLNSIYYSELGSSSALVTSGSVSIDRVNNFVLYSASDFIISGSSFSILSNSGSASSDVLYSQPCLTRYGYWLNGVHTNIFTPNGNQPIPVLMTRGSGDMYYIITCRFADYQDFRLNVERLESNNRYSYNISVDFVYSVFGVSASDPANWERLSQNDAPGSIVSVSNRNDLVASTYPVSFADNIDNVYFWQNPMALTTYSNSPVYIPPLGDNVSSFDELEGDFLENVDSILNGFVVEFFDGLSNNLSYLYSAFESWRFLIGGIIVDRFYVVVSCSLACGVIMLMVGLFSSVLKGGKKE